VGITLSNVVQLKTVYFYRNVEHLWNGWYLYARSSLRGSR